MKTIELKCGCGAAITLRDDAGTFVNDDGQPDDNGKRALIWVQANTWLDRHEGCKKAKASDADSFLIHDPEPDYKGRCERARAELLDLKHGMISRAIAILEGRE